MQFHSCTPCGLPTRVDFAVMAANTRTGQDGTTGIHLCFSSNVLNRLIIIIAQVVARTTTAMAATLMRLDQDPGVNVVRARLSIVGSQSPGHEGCTLRPMERGSK